LIGMLRQQSSAQMGDHAEAIVAADGRSRS
jgi:hypothetical protein